MTQIVQIDQEGEYAINLEDVDGLFDMELAQEIFIEDLEMLELEEIGVVTKHWKNIQFLYHVDCLLNCLSFQTLSVKN